MFRICRNTIVFCALTLLSGISYGQFIFEGPIISDCDLDTREMVLCYLDGDENIDIAVINFTNNSISTLLGDGTGKFECFSIQPIGQYPTDIANADFDGDGAQDIVLLTQEPQNEVTFLYGKGDGEFESLTNLDIGSPNDVITDDFNADAIPDVAFGEGISSVKTLLGNDMGAFGQGGTATVGTAPIVLFSDDLNRDGFPDIVTGHSVSNDFSIIFGDGLGFFSEPIFFSTQGNPWDFQFGDINGDTNKDIVAAVNGEVSAIKLYKGNGFGEFTILSTINLMYQPLGIVLEDFNDDGLLDLIISIDKVNTDNILIYQGNGLGGFYEVLKLSTEGYPGQLFAQDVDHDGLIDLVVNDARVSVFLNKPLVSTTEELATSLAFTATPNPNNGRWINLNLSDNLNGAFTMMIFDPLGHLLQQTEHQFGQTNVILDLPHLPNGVYLLSLVHENAYSTQRILVQH